MFLLLLFCTQQFRWWHMAEGSNYFQVYGAKLERGSGRGVVLRNALSPLFGRLDELLLAVCRNVKKPPSRLGVQLSLVSTKHPHIGHPHHLVFTSLDHFTISVLDTEDLLAVKGDNQDRALFHHLAHRQVQRVNVQHSARDHQPHLLGLSDRGG